MKILLFSLVIFIWGAGLALAQDKEITLSPQEYEQVLAALASKDPIMSFLMKKQSEAQDKIKPPAQALVKEPVK